MSNANGFEGTAENLEKIKPRLDELRPGEVRQFNLSVPSTVTVGMRIWKAYKLDQTKFVETFTKRAFDPVAYEDFPERVGALWYLNVQLQQVTDPKGDLDGILAEIVPLHSKLGKSAAYLWGDSEELGDIVADIRSGGGHADKADDLVRYTALFEEHWAEADGSCAVTKDDLVKSRALAAKLMDAMTAVPASDIAELKNTRDRAGEYLRRGVDDIRDAAAYIFRSDPEAVERYPSLFTRGASKRKRPAKAETEPSAPRSAE